MATSRHGLTQSEPHRSGPVEPDAPARFAARRAAFIAQLASGSTETDQVADVPHRPGPAVLASLRGSSLPGTVIPRSHGGTGGDAVLANGVVAEVARHHPSLAIVLFQHLAVSGRITEWGTPRQRADLLPPLADGTWLAASAWSEPGAGANKRNISTTAVRQPDGSWLLTGEKNLATGAGLADLYLILARTGAGVGTSGSYGSTDQTFFLVRAGTDGLQTQAGPELEGMRASATGLVRLAGCRVDPQDVLGEIGGAARIIAGVRDSGVTLGAVSVGIAEAAYHLAAEHLTRAGGLADQVSRHRLVDLRVRVEAARAVVEHAGRRTGDDPGLVTLYSKIFASVEAERVCRQAQGLLGSAGYLSSHPINQLARDARAVALMGPTNDLCRELVSASWQS
ncbi:MAG: acyl-CoA dehydrogenase family protein [Actinobacteria bacterium]|nr:acyl-CoA dehydrogenase family protein [Actinomycetota bacterium]